MPLETTRLQQLLCENLCKEVRIVRRPGGKLMLRTGFQFPDGDRFPIHVSETATNGVRLSDLGHTLMRISYDHDLDSFLQDARGRLLETIVNESGIGFDGGVLYVECSLESLPEAIFRFGQTLTRVYELARLNHGGTIPPAR